jgi:hypothetical protein
MRSALVVITTKQRAERIRSITVSIAASATGGICEIIPTRLDGCWRNIAVTLFDPVQGGFERNGLITAAALLPHTSAQYYLVIYLQLRVVLKRATTLLLKLLKSRSPNKGSHAASPIKGKDGLLESLLQPVFFSA